MTQLPTPFHADDCVTSLEPKQQGEFPDRLRFPPPAGKDGACGCLMTYWSNGAMDPAEAAGRIAEWHASPESEREENHGSHLPQLLETIWQPLYDTAPVTPGGGSWVFFQNPGGRGSEFTNLESAGQLTWPRRFTAWEIDFQFSHPPEELGLIGRATQHSAVVTMSIGEKRHFQMPLISLYNPSPTKYRAALCSPLYIPPVQHFMVRLETPHHGVYGKPGVMRCTLSGYHHRPIP